MNIKDSIDDAASFEEIEAFEAKHRIKLPDDYRQFLLSHNGGRPEMTSRMFVFQKEDGLSSDSLVDWFSGLRDSEDYSLEEDLDIYEDRIPEGMLPIACDPFGNLILLGVREQHVSGVWFWDHEIEPTNVEESGIYKVASSFGTFAENLSPVTE